MPDDTAPPSSPPAKGRGVLRRHPVLVALVMLLVLVVGGGVGASMYLTTTLDGIDRFELFTLPENRRPQPTGGSSGDAVNILLAGVDKGDGRSIAEIQDGGWDAGVLRTDTIMVLHVTADRERAYLISVPRDSYVRLYDATGRPQGMDKINAAFSLFGPTAYLSTVENLTGLRMDHLAVVDWAGFEDITNALGGVEVSVAGGGARQLDGDEALAYVRTRYGLPGGDFDRIDRQQNFLRSMLGTVLSGDTLANPFTLNSTLRAVVGNLTVDDAFDTDEMRELALSLRSLRTGDITFLTAPFGDFGTTAAGASIVRLDQAQADMLWRATADDEIAGYLDEYGAESEQLPQPGQVN